MLSFLQLREALTKRHNFKNGQDDYLDLSKQTHTQKLEVSNSQDQKLQKSQSMPNTEFRRSSLPQIQNQKQENQSEIKLQGHLNNSIESETKQHHKMPKIKRNFNATSSSLMFDQHKNGFKNTKIKKIQEELASQKQTFMEDTQDQEVQQVQKVILKQNNSFQKKQSQNLNKDIEQHFNKQSNNNLQPFKKMKIIKHDSDQTLFGVTDGISPFHQRQLTQQSQWNFENGQNLQFKVQSKFSNQQLNQIQLTSLQQTMKTSHANSFISETTGGPGQTNGFQLLPKIDQSSIDKIPIKDGNDKSKLEVIESHRTTQIIDQQKMTSRKRELMLQEKLENLGIKRNKSLAQLSSTTEKQNRDKLQAQQELRVKESIKCEKQSKQTMKEKKKFSLDFAIQKNSVVKIINSTLTRLKKMYEIENVRSNVELQKENSKTTKSISIQLRNERLSNYKNNISQRTSLADQSSPTLLLSQKHHPNFKLDLSQYNTMDQTTNLMKMQSMPNLNLNLLPNDQQFQDTSLNHRFLLFNEDQTTLDSKRELEQKQQEKYFQLRKNSKYLQKFEDQKLQNQLRLFEEQHQKLQVNQNSINYQSTGSQSNLMLDVKKTQFNNDQRIKATGDLLMLKQLKNFETDFRSRTKQVGEEQQPFSNHMISSIVNKQINSKSSFKQSQLSKRNESQSSNSNQQVNAFSPVDTLKLSNNKNLNTYSMRTIPAADFSENSSKLNSNFTTARKPNSTYRMSENADSQNKKSRQDIMLSFDIKIKTTSNNSNMQLNQPNL
eukprot:403372158